jgi:hypothetical protein
MQLPVGEPPRWPWHQRFRAAIYVKIKKDISNLFTSFIDVLQFCDYPTDSLKMCPGPRAAVKSYGVPGIYTIGAIGV